MSLFNSLPASASEPIWPGEAGEHPARNAGRQDAARSPNSEEENATRLTSGDAAGRRRSERGERERDREVAVRTYRMRRAARPARERMASVDERARGRAREPGRRGGGG